MRRGDKIENASSRFYDCEEPRAIERARDRVTIRALDNTLQITRSRPAASERERAEFVKNAISSHRYGSRPPR